MFVDIGVGDDQRVLDDGPRADRKQPVEAAIEGDVGDDRHQYGWQHGDDREQANDLDMQPSGGPASAARLNHLPHLAGNNAQQQQDGRAVNQKERDDDLVGGRNGRQPGQDNKGQEGRQQRKANSKRREQPAQRPAGRLG